MSAQGAAGAIGKTLLVMAGGTGGHVFPGLAVADLLSSRNWKVVWMGAPGSMEAKLVPGRGYEMAWVRFAALRGKGLLRKLLLPFHLLCACWQAQRELRRVQPDVVLGMGGYISFPGGLMAVLLRYPLVIHEQNSVAGLANRVLAKFADRVACGFPDVLPKGVWVGNPLRPEMNRVPAPAVRLAGRQPPLHLLVLGGSLGAAALNEMVPKGLALIDAAARPEVVHQAGEKHLAQLQENYRAAGVQAHCAAFIDDMAAAYQWADLVLCRAGALTVAELAATGVASVLVPFPYAVDDHQTANARFLSRAGGATLLPQSELTPEAIGVLGNYSHAQLAQMAAQAHQLAKPEAAADVARMCEELVQ
ncbi:MAG: UDP-N-acetylglucosamine--N-acetylmuramyl-(pentapeptide) pyrophosphoryl-undecaprenol N-acetylglucosamine transferase [Candidatus Accumulibacter regalis]|jgi:UDP-N-acetylglucosamine--N-acetylmuramyl-(pentapeptide) pyrophosphoryl-undecaprenol N-acetylglucosamine transferase|uniref:UDP-N-acetylglucosamine--N-acetylmuramyl-(pentapeptide) pyrophosphoryl-undecaprenol N-acetylglucosamine transferase n=1 Tax=Accumulibacter regalis TaxID=522306 RepID=A0A011QBS9_ACCRE|nr:MULTISPECIES: undecaprenyldiphospho-muramoylpentapeptide beta-N-acetylglucosaminyltransferase [unclassified Candidatus Accumulibacter]EXI86525.1 MAG: UDP-N-acetylglucosamine--N-acetylmuramyl-(pentapeptide) pyrophosphoryl-undecaprenol N-acetylglucosamine transferase [Candidatus Accumulibacter regalis]MQM35083.1 undecaprenyldiphospho-muramoylpentapeptide beta-N-acetylglucosaminyltransferase [Candidatus Accumulibacter phosphatis]MBL8369469.1 undecaprenyldiphospho-muramoylpentapeptide beta-N-acet